MAEFNYGKESNLNLATRNDNFYRFTDIDGNVRLIKDTPSLGDEGFVELNPVDGSEIRSLSGEQAGILIPNDLMPLTDKEKAEFPKVFEQFDKDVNGSDGVGIDAGGNTILGGAGQRDGESDANFAARTNSQFSLAEQKAMQQGDGIFDRVKSWWNESKEIKLGDKPLGTDDIATADSAVINSNANASPIIAENTPSYLQNDSKRIGGSESYLQSPNQASQSASNIDPNDIVNADSKSYSPTDYNGPTSDQPSGRFTTSTENPSFLQASTQGEQQGKLLPAEPGKKDNNSWGSADGWNAAGSVMKGVGGLASAWTGIQNYKLARDAHNTQKNQWQANYDQRIQAYGDNKNLMNEEIRRKNRTLKARGQAESYSELT